MTLIKVDHTEYGLEEQKAQQIAQMFRPMLDQMEALEVQYNHVMEMDMSPERQQLARETRLDYVKVRTGTDKIHKELKAFYLNGGRFVDGWKNAQRMASLGNEEKLKEIEDYYENLEKERVARLYQERKEELSKYTEFIPMELGQMDEQVWQNYLAGAKHTYEETKRIEAQMEEDRKEEERKKAERERKRNQELDRLRKERKKKEAELAEERRIQEEKLARERKEREEAQRKLKEKEDAERKAKEEEEALIQAALNKGDEAKWADLIEELSLIRLKYTFKAKKYQEAYMRLDTVLMTWVQSL
jgi:hypothetical protein